MPPPIQGLGASNGFQMQVGTTDGSYDFERLQAVTDQIVQAANAVAAVRGRVYRRSRHRAAGDRERRQDPRLDTQRRRGRRVQHGPVYLGSSFVNLFTRYGHNYMVYLQADPLRRLNVQDVKDLYVRSQEREHGAVGAVADIQRVARHRRSCRSTTCFPRRRSTACRRRARARVRLSRPWKKIAQENLPRGMAYEWTAMSYQERLVGSSAYFIFALSILLVYFVLCGQYESWITPAAVILAVPWRSSARWPRLKPAGFSNNIYVQIGLVLLIALSAKNAILIVEMAREGRAAGRSIPDATVEASRVRFRPILMTSFTFILGVLPLVVASGAGAEARRSLGIAVASGMLASTCLAVLFVPALFVVLQRWAERRTPAPRDI